MPHYKFKVLPSESGKRLDLFILGFCQEQRLGLSRTFIQKLLKDGAVTIGEIKIEKPNYKVKAAEEVAIRFEKKSNEVAAENIPIDVVYEDRDLAIINKPSGLVVHPAPGNYTHTLVNALLFRFKNLSDINPQRPGIVHRLDKDTSGLLVIAKNNQAHLALAEQFASHNIKRKYVALVEGRLAFNEDVIEAPIGRHPLKRKNMSVGFGKKTKYAKTYYRTLKRLQDSSLVELEPYTGRTHQLRVHLAFLGHPILGDTKYGKNNEVKRLALHAQILGFRHPGTNKFVEFSSEIPVEFSDFIKRNKT